MNYSSIRGWVSYFHVCRFFLRIIITFEMFFLEALYYKWSFLLQQTSKFQVNEFYIHQFKVTFSTILHLIHVVVIIDLLMNFQYSCKMPKKMNKKLNPPCRFLVPTSFSSLRKISLANRMSVEANSAIHQAIGRTVPGFG